MMNFEKSIRALLAARGNLLTQIEAVDRALLILGGESTKHASAPAVRELQSVPEVRRVRPKRVLSEEHKRALVEGRQKARLAKEVAAGRAFEPVPAIAASASDAPRLVKRRELTLEV